MDVRQRCLWQGTITALQFDDYKLITGSDDGTVKLWDMTTGRFVCNLLVHGRVIWRIQFNASTLAIALERNDPTGTTSEIVVMDFEEAAEAQPPTPGSSARSSSRLSLTA